jgi:lipopolysaccharide biosynthesis protein
MPKLDAQLRKAPLTVAAPPRIVAFFLPQFHEIPENNRWWGKGFTDWTNTQSARSMFIGHNHPRVPSDGRLFDLTEVAELKKQSDDAELAGIDAFCMYFYWFHKQRLLERPLDLYKDLDGVIPFCLSWANENWTRRWDGKDNEVLIAQQYEDQTPAQVYASLKPYFDAPHYLKQGGNPILLVHRAEQLPDPLAYAREWRQLARNDGWPDLHLVATEVVPGIDPTTIGFDAVAEFPPVGRNGLRHAALLPPRGLLRTFSGRLMSYEKIAVSSCRRMDPDFVRYRGVMPGWDNTARRGNDATVYMGQSPERFGWWLRCALRKERNIRGRRGLVFINAWNEWAEGAYLQSDNIHGDGYLKATRGAVESLKIEQGLFEHCPPNTGDITKAWRPSAGHSRSLMNATLSSIGTLVRKIGTLTHRSLPHG